MSISVAAIIQSVRRTLQDTITGQLRYPDDALVSFLNEAQVEVCRYKPDANVKNENITTVSGIAQALPTGAIRLIDIVCNANGSAIIQADKKEFSLQYPGWTKETATADARAYMYDAANPTQFWVYPPLTGTGQIRAVYSARPTAALLAGNITIPDEYAASIAHYICFKAYSEDTMSPDANKAAMFHGLFLSSLQMSEAGDSAVEPRRSAYADK